MLDLDSINTVVLVVSVGWLCAFILDACKNHILKEISVGNQIFEDMKIYTHHHFVYLGSVKLHAKAILRLIMCTCMFCFCILP